MHADNTKREAQTFALKSPCVAGLDSALPVCMSTQQWGAGRQLFSWDVAEDVTAT